MVTACLRLQELLEGSRNKGNVRIQFLTKEEFATRLQAKQQSEVDEVGTKQL